MTDGDASGAHAHPVRRLGASSLLCGALAGVIVGTFGLLGSAPARWIVAGVAAVAVVVATVVLKRQVSGPDFETGPDRSHPLWRVDRVTRTGSFTSALMVPASFLFRTDVAGSTVFWLVAAVVAAAPAVAAGCWALRQQVPAEV